MKSILLLIVGILVGGAISFAVFTGVGAGVGIITGLKAGACLTVEAAKNQGLITAEQVDEVLNTAARQIATEQLADEPLLEGGDAECAQVVEELRQAVAESQ